MKRRTLNPAAGALNDVLKIADAPGSAPGLTYSGPKGDGIITFESGQRVVRATLSPSLVEACEKDEALAKRVVESFTEHARALEFRGGVRDASFVGNSGEFVYQLQAYESPKNVVTF